MDSQCAVVPTTPVPHPLLRPSAGSEERDSGSSDASLVEGMAAGEPAAFEELHRRYSSILHALTLRMLRNTEDARDAVQETFVQAWRLAPRYRRNRASVSTWLGMMARSRALDHLRRRRTRAESATEPQDQLEEGVPARGAENLLHSQRKERVQAALADIPMPQREVLELRFWHGLTQTEIAAEIGIPLGTVKTRTLLAFRKLREGLVDEIGDLL